MESLSLSSYFDIFPQPAVILELTQDSSLTVDSFQVCYVNRWFVSLIGLNGLSNQPPAARGMEFEEERSLLGADFNEAVLQRSCLSPTPTQFMDWIKGISHTPDELHFLKSRFSLPDLNKLSPASDQSETVVDVEWNGLAMKGKYVILTGRTSSHKPPSASSTASTSPELLPGQDVRSSDPLDNNPGCASNPESPTTSTTNPTRQRVSRSSSRDVKSTSPITTSPVIRPRLTTRNSFPVEDGPTSTWRNNEKVPLNRSN